ncbi:hypothetical protein EDD21DRAFT_422129 [Dissophora ornata]|nr:hypothetical protein BGZ58_002869 [Dissophora ornata]KAI8606760.1 hypothetical protein EDD21DRAFT_422129 [Dissophora ornata]
MKTTLSTSTIGFAAMRVLAFLTLVRADRVYWTTPANNSDAYTGCNLNLGFRVQYSDLAMLAYVQLQVLNAENEVVIDCLDNSTRSDWDDKRAKNITWSVPQDWPSGDYILRAFGDATYPCTENGHRKFCRLQLEDRETIHVHQQTAGQSCPASPSASHKSSHASSPSSSPSSLSLGLSSSSSLPSTMPSTAMTEPTDKTIANSGKADKSAAVNGTDASTTPQTQSSMHIDVNHAVLNLMRQNGVRLDLNKTTDTKLETSDDAEGKGSTTETQKNLVQQPSATSTNTNKNTGSAVNNAAGKSKMTGSGVGLVALMVATLLF